MRKRVIKKFLLLFLIMLLAGCSLYDETHEFKYEVTGSESFNYDVSYTDETGNFKRIEKANRNWSYTWSETKRHGEITSLYICAMNYGTVTVRIYKDGKIINENSNTGNSAISATGIEVEF